MAQLMDNLGNAAATPADCLFRLSAVGCRRIGLNGFPSQNRKFAQDFLRRGISSGMEVLP